MSCYQGGRERGQSVCFSNDYSEERKVEPLSGREGERGAKYQGREGEQRRGSRGRRTEGGQRAEAVAG